MSGKRWVWRRPDIENFRRVLEGRPTKPVKTSADDELVTINQLAKELRVHPQTITRRVAEARKAYVLANPPRYPALVKLASPHGADDVLGTLDDCYSFRRMNLELASAWERRDKAKGFDAEREAELMAFDRELKRLDARAAKAARGKAGGPPAPKLQ
jgi:hypothetical protein